MTDDDLHTDALRRLAAVGLTTESAINENEQRWAERSALLRSLPSHPAYDDKPPRLTDEQLADWAELDGFSDAALNRPSSAAARFCEGDLHHNNFARFEWFRVAYQRAYQRKREQEAA